MPYRYAYPAASYKDYPTEWGGVAQGITQGIANAASILGTERAQEDQAMKRDLAAKTAAEYEYMNKPVTTVGAMINAVPDMDDAGRQKLGALAASYGYGPDDPISRKHMTDISNLVNSNPIFADVTATEKRRFLQSQLAGAPDDATKQAITNKLNLLNRASKEMELKEREVQSKEKTAQAHETAAEAKGPRTWQELAIEEGWPAEKIAAKEAAIYRQKHPTVGVEKPMSDAQITLRNKRAKELLDNLWIAQVQNQAEKNIAAVKADPDLMEGEKWSKWSSMVDAKGNIKERISAKNFQAKMDPEMQGLYNQQSLLVESLVANGADPRAAVDEVIRRTYPGNAAPAQPNAKPTNQTTVQTWTRDAQGRPVRK